MSKKKLVLFIKNRKIASLKKQKKYPLYTGILLLLFTYNLAALATTKEPHDFEPYQASYRFYWQGLEVGTSVHRLKKIDDRHYVASASTSPFLKILPFRSNESSHFFIAKHHIYPTYYQYQSQESKKRKKGSLIFDWQRKRIQNQTLTLPTLYFSLPNNAQDKITLFFQIRADLQIHKKELSYTVVEEKGIKNYRFKITGKETVKTPFGVFETLRLEHLSDNQERLSKVWVAKDLDYLMLRLQQFKNGKLTAETRIKKLEYLP